MWTSNGSKCAAAPPVEIPAAGELLPWHPPGMIRVQEILLAGLCFGALFSLRLPVPFSGLSLGELIFPALFADQFPDLPSELSIDLKRARLPGHALLRSARSDSALLHA